MGKINLKKEVEILKNKSIQFFRGEEIKKAVLTYKKIQFLCPKEEKYYLVYLGFLNDEIIMAEFAQDIYTEVSELCTRAIQHLDADKLLPFYEKKTENYIELIDGSFGVWYEDANNNKEVGFFIEEVLQQYNQTPSILKKLHALYHITGKETKEIRNLLNKAYKILKKDDFQLLIFNVIDLENENKIMEAVALMESYIANNNSEKNELEILYSKLISLNTTINKVDRVNYYEETLDNLD